MSEEELEEKLEKPEGVSEEEWRAYLEAKEAGMLGVDPLWKIDTEV